MYTHAIVRRPGPDLAQGLTMADYGAPDYERALRQHACYVQALVDAGLEVVVLDPLPGYPDAYFVEDVAVALPEVAVITRPGAPSRLGEEKAIAHVLAQYRPTLHIVPPGTVDGGDVLALGKQVFVGISSRTNETGANQLRAMLARFGYSVTAVPVASGLHLKSGVGSVGETALLVATALEAEAFASFHRIRVPDGEGYAANSLLVNDRILMPSGFPRTRRELERLGMPLVELDVSEARTMDGGLTCMSIRF